MASRNWLVFAAIAGTLALAPPASAQEASDASEAERLKQAKQEQEDLRVQEKAAEEQARREASDAAEQARLEKAGLTGVEPPIEEQGGFFLNAEAGWTEMDGAERTVAREYEIETSAVTAEDLDSDGDGLPDAYTRGAGRDLRLTYDAQLAPSLEIGWRRKAGGAFSLKYWSFSSDAATSASSSRRFASAGLAQGDLVLGGIDTPALSSTPANAAANPEAFGRAFGSPLQLVNQGLHGADSVSAEGTLEASRLDLLYSRTALASKRTEVLFRAGLTYMKISRDEQASLNWTSYSRAEVFNQRSSAETIETSCETAAFGVTAGVLGRWGFTADRRWGLRVGLDVAGMQATQELAFRNAQLLSQPGLPEQPPDVYQDTTDDDSGQFVSVVETDAAIEGRLGRHVRLSVGYRFGKIFEALTNEQYPSAASASPLTSGTVDLDTQGPYLRLGVFF